MRRQWLGAAIGVLVVALAGCGGGSGGNSVGDSNQSNGRDACPLTQYTPNYASGIDLSFWPQFPVHVFFDTGSVSYTPALQTRAIAAFNTWVTQTNGQVAFTVVNNLADADITVGFVTLGDAKLTDNDADGITYYFEPRDPNNGTANALSAYVRIYIGIDGTTIRENGTMAHEFGHALGIRGHSPDSHDIMYYAYNAGRSSIPTLRDVNTLYTAYCGVFTRSVATDRAVTARPHRAPMPPLSAPGWKAIR